MHIYFFFQTYQKEIFVKQNLIFLTFFCKFSIDLRVRMKVCIINFLLGSGMSDDSHILCDLFDESTQKITSPCDKL